MKWLERAFTVLVRKTSPSWELSHNNMVEVNCMFSAIMRKEQRLSRCLPSNTADAAGEARKISPTSGFKAPLGNLAQTELPLIDHLCLLQ